MKKLDLNVEIIRLEGRPSQVLQPPIDDIDKCIQNLCNSTENMKSVMCNYSGTNQGKQFKKACNTISIFSQNLYETSIALNDIQNQVAAYAYKCSEYEEERSTVSPPRKLSVNIVRMNVNTGVVYFRKAEMIAVRNELQVYCEECKNAIKRLKNQANALNSVWKDPQKDDYCKLIESTCDIIFKASQSLGEYRDHLTNIINNL